MDKYIVAVYVPTPADAVRELMELKDELTKVYGIRIICAMKRGTPTLETEKGVIQFYSEAQVRRYALFGKKFSIESHSYTAGREMDHTEFHGSFLDYILEKEKE